ncbi:MAG: hypothetical protein NDP22_03705, partial [Crenarchaeota archaeon]|nr:hypothetical protein [Thermoproteota archaeon]
VLIGHSSLKDVYYQGEDLIIDVSVWNNGTSALRIIHFNLTIWRVEKRYDRLRNVELVYNSTIKKNETISPGQIYSLRILVTVTFQPAQYNLSLAVVTRFALGAAGEREDYIIPTYLFWVKPTFEVPTIVWAIVVEVVLIGLAIYIYRRLRVS